LRWVIDARPETCVVIVSRLSVSCAPAGYRFPPEVIALAVRWYRSYGLSDRDGEELLAERGVEVDHVTIYAAEIMATSDALAEAGQLRT